MELLLHQLSKPLVESMMISRGGFNHRVHNIVELNVQGKSFYSEVIGDSKLISFVFNHLSSFLKIRDIKTVDLLYECVDEWYKNFVYLESASSVYSIYCAITGYILI